MRTFAVLRSKSADMVNWKSRVAVRKDCNAQQLTSPDPRTEYRLYGPEPDRSFHTVTDSCYPQ